jgi:hypothetical protein
MVKVSAGRDAVTLKLEGVKKFLAVKSKITIPLANVVKVSTEQVKPLASKNENRSACARSAHGWNILGEARQDILLCKGLFKVCYIALEEP